ncbi:MAG: ROK family protein [Candidatus Coproplasma sp.]
MNELNNKFYIGIDIGGMSLKGVEVDGDGKIICEDTAPTGEKDGGKSLAENVCELVNALIAKSGHGAIECAGVGIGCPGVIDSKNGTVVFAGNLSLKNFPLVAEVQKAVNLPVKITNDANAAALGEAKFGAGKAYDNAVFITLGTGVGGGVIIGGKLFEGYKSAGAELGHMVIVEGGRACTCGRKGCFEAYASATALIKSTVQAMEEDKNSAMWKSYTPETVTGKTAFEYMDSDPAAKKVVEEYIRYLACGLTSIANIFRPQIIMLGGGVCNQGERLIAPVRELVKKEIFGGTDYADIEVVKATLGNSAGALGAASLIM